MRARFSGAGGGAEAGVGAMDRRGPKILNHPLSISQDFQQMMAGMPQGEQQKLMVMLEEMQLKEQVTMYNSLVERCA